MASTIRLQSSSSYGNYEKDLVDLKKLLQQTLEEIKTICFPQTPKSDDHGNSVASIADQARDDLIKDVNAEVSEMVEELERRRSTTTEVQELRQLRYAMEEDYQQFVSLIRRTHENMTQARRMHHLEALKAIQKSRAGQGHQFK